MTDKTTVSTLPAAGWQSGLRALVDAVAREHEAGERAMALGGFGLPGIVTSDAFRELASDTAERLNMPVEHAETALATLWTAAVLLLGKSAPDDAGRRCRQIHKVAMHTPAVCRQPPPFDDFDDNIPF